MGFIPTSSGSIKTAIAAGDAFFKFTARTDDLVFTAGAEAFDNNVLGIAVGPGSDIDSFDITFPNPNNLAGQRTRIRIDPKRPFLSRLPIGGVSPALLSVVSVRPTNVAVLNNGGVEPSSELLFLVSNPVTEKGGPRAPSFTSLLTAGFAPETTLLQRYCYGRHRFYFSLSVVAGAAVTCRVAGRKLVGTAVQETNLANFSIGAGGGNAIAENFVGTFDMIRAYITGATAANAVLASLEVRDES